MKINLFADVNIQYKEDQIICLSDYSKMDLKQLIISIRRLFTENEIILNKEPFINCSECTLKLKMSSSEIGIIYKKDTDEYVCLLTKSGYEKIIEIIYNEINSTRNGYFWLYDINTPIDFLLSKNAKW